MNAIAKTKPAEIVDAAPQGMNPMTLIDRAIAGGAGIETIEKLMGLQERWEANQARRDFNEAVAAAKASIKPVTRNKEGHNSKRYADFAAIARDVDPILAEHGLSYRFRSEQGERISVTCILSHRAGHQEQTTLTGPADTSGSKNAIQAIGSTLTYLQRYSLVQMLGLAATDDDDGRGSGMGEAITPQQVETLQAAINEADADIGAFRKFFKIETLPELPAARYAEAVDMLARKRAKK